MKLPVNPIGKTVYDIEDNPYTIVGIRVKVIARNGKVKVLNIENLKTASWHRGAKQRKTRKYKTIHK